MRTTKAQISIFVVRCLDSIISLVSISEISRLNLVSAAEQASLSLTWSQTPEDRFSRDVAHMLWNFTRNMFYCKIQKKLDTRKTDAFILKTELHGFP